MFLEKIIRLIFAKFHVADENNNILVVFLKLLFFYDLFVEITTAAAAPAKGEVLLLMGEDSL